MRTGSTCSIENPNAIVIVLPRKFTCDQTNKLFAAGFQATWKCVLNKTCTTDPSHKVGESTKHSFKHIEWYAHEKYERNTIRLALIIS